MGVGYKGWMNRQRLYAKTYSSTFDWLDDLKKYRKWVLLLAFLVLSSLYEVHARTNPYNFPYDNITMDVVKSDHTGGGAYLCPTLQLCYIKVLEAEARGATQYCESITIKRNEQIVWQRFYQLRGN